MAHSSHKRIDTASLSVSVYVSLFISAHALSDHRRAFRGLICERWFKATLPLKPRKALVPRALPTNGPIGVTVDGTYGRSLVAVAAAPAARARVCVCVCVCVCVVAGEGGLCVNMRWNKGAPPVRRTGQRR